MSVPTFPTSTAYAAPKASQPIALSYPQQQQQQQQSISALLAAYEKSHALASLDVGGGGSVGGGGGGTGAGSRGTSTDMAYDEGFDDDEVARAYGRVPPEWRDCLGLPWEEMSQRVADRLHELHDDPSSTWLEPLNLKEGRAKEYARADAFDERAMGGATGHAHHGNSSLVLSQPPDDEGAPSVESSGRNSPVGAATRKRVHWADTATVRLHLPFSVARALRNGHPDLPAVAPNLTEQWQVTVEHHGKATMRDLVSEP